MKDNHGVEEEINGDGQEPDLYIFYPVEESNEQKQVSAESFRGIHKIGIQVPLKEQTKER